MIQLHLTFSVRSIFLVFLLGVALFAGADVARGAPSSADLTVDGNVVFTGPNQSGAKDIHTSATNGGLRIYNGTSLSPIPTGAAIQFFGNGSTSFPGQAFIDSGAHNNGAIIFRTAGTGGAITERLRIDASGNITATGNFSTTGIINVPRGIQIYTPAASPGTFIVPAGVNKVLVQAWGAGGGGGGCVTPCAVVAGGGGGGGGAAQALFDVSPGNVFSVVVGPGGLAGNDGGATATTGGDTVVIFGSTAITAGGGSAGTNSGDHVGLGGSGGVANIIPPLANGITSNGTAGTHGGADGLGGLSGGTGGGFRPSITGAGGPGITPTRPAENGGGGFVVIQW